MKLRSRLAITCAKGTSALIKKLNRGSGVTLPGYVARLIDPNILSVMASQIREKTIVTMGTNGKTTTNAILYKALKAEGKTVIINRTGANMLNGIISAFVLATDKHGQLNADYACIEVDEIASVGVLPQLKPDCALLTNISRDQLDRFGEVDITFDKLKTAVTSVPDTTLIINCDDILSYSLAETSGNPFVTYGISEQIFDDISRSEIRESIFCRKCGRNYSMISSIMDSLEFITARTADGSARILILQPHRSRSKTNSTPSIWEICTWILRYGRLTIFTIPLLPIRHCIPCMPRWHILKRWQSLLTMETTGKKS